MHDIFAIKHNNLNFFEMKYCAIKKHLYKIVPNILQFMIIFFNRNQFKLTPNIYILNLQRLL